MRKIYIFLATFFTSCGALVLSKEKRSFIKTFSLSFFTIISCVFVTAAPKTWIGTSGSNWNNNANWTPSGVPGSLDDVTVNGSTIILIDVSPININSILITNNSTVIFDCNATRNITLNSTSSLTPGLKIDAGSTLNIDGSNVGTNNSTLLFTGAAGVVGSISGTLIFSSTGGTRVGNSIRMDTFSSISNYGIVTVYSGGAIKIFPDAGNTQTSITPVPNLIMLNGSLYENLKNGGSFPDGTWQSTSLAKASCPGTNGPSFNGMSYGNLEWNCPNQNNFSLLTDLTFNNVNLINTNIASGNAFRITNSAAATRSLTINGNLDISTNSKLEITGPLVSSNGGTLNLKGHLNNAGTITTTGIPGTVNNFILNGTTVQNITNTGTISGSELDFIMNNSAGAQLLSALTLPGNTTNSLQLTTGKIFTTSSFLLTMIDNAGYTVGSPTSFIEGPMKKIGDETFLFPVGVGSILAPLGLTTLSGESITDEFTAEYKRIDPRSVHGTNLAPGMDHISYVEYWSLTTSNSPMKLVSLAVNYTSFCYDLSKTYVSRYNGTLWTNQGSTFILTGTFGLLQQGVITSTSTLSAYGDFTLITDLPFSGNPLPIKLVTFKAIKSGNATLLNWELAACCSPDARFEVEKSSDGINFSVINHISGSQTNRFYNTIDSRLSKGITYYRLKMIETDGKISYSKIVAVINDDKGLLITSISPNPVRDEAVITLSAAKQGTINFQLYNLSGAIVKQWQSTIAEGTNNISISTGDLAAGVYHLSASGVDSKTVFRMVKQ